MRILSVLRFRLIVVTVMFSMHQVVSLDDPVTDKIVEEHTSSTHPCNLMPSTAELSAADLRNTLKLLLRALNKQPDIETIKLIGHVVNITNGEKNQEKLMEELRKHGQLKSLIDTLKFNANNSTTKSEFELFPAELRNAIIEEVLQFHNSSGLLTENLEGSTESYTGNSSVEDLSTAVTAKSISEEEDKTASLISAPPPGLQKKEVQEISQLNNRIQSKPEFPYSEHLLQMLQKYHLKYTRTHEVIEPLPTKEKKDNKTKKIGSKNKKSKKGKGGNCDIRQLLSKIVTLINDFKKANHKKQNYTTSTVLTPFFMFSATGGTTNNITEIRRLTGFRTTRKPNRPPGNRIGSLPLDTVSMSSTESAKRNTEF